MLTINALVAAGGVIIAMQCEYFALEGLAALSRTIKSVAETLNEQPADRGYFAHHVRPS